MSSVRLLAPGNYFHQIWIINSLFGRDLNLGATKKFHTFLQKVLEYISQSESRNLINNYHYS